MIHRGTTAAVGDDDEVAIAIAKTRENLLRRQGTARA